MKHLCRLFKRAQDSRDICMVYVNTTNTLIKLIVKQRNYETVFNEDFINSFVNRMLFL